MRIALCLVLIMSAAAGCRHAAPPEEAKRERRFNVISDVAADKEAKAKARAEAAAKAVTAPKGAPKPAKATETKPAKPEIRPSNIIRGSVASVNTPARFVVVDFANSRLPRLDQRLNVYRVGEKVAEIKISGPFRNTNVAADIVAGEPLFGDEVRAD